VLVIANLYHATPRIPGICKYLPEFGWDPVIISPETESKESTHVALQRELLPSLEIQAVGEGATYESTKAEFGLSGAVAFLNHFVSRIDPRPDSRIQKIADSAYWRFYSFLTYPDPNMGWRDIGYAAASTTVGRMHFDAILSSSSPIVAHLIAKQVNEETRIPWIAELRDLWSGNYAAQAGPLLRQCTKRLETKTLKKAVIIVTVSPELEKPLRILHPQATITHITNGFDPEEVPEVRSPPSKFTITYTGQVYEGKQDPNAFFEALSDLIGNGQIDKSKVEVRFFGPYSRVVSTAAMQYGLEEVVQQRPPVPRRESLQMQWDSQCLLLLNWNDKTQPGVVPLKVYEYIHTGNRIIATGGYPGDAVSRILDTTKCGVVAYDRDQAKEAIMTAYSAYRDGRSSANCVSSEVDRFSYRALAREYAGLLDEASKWSH